MNVTSWLLWGFVATVFMTTVQAICQGLRLTRISYPLLIGTIFTPDRDRARLYGVFVHIVNGLVFSLVYILVFESLHRATWWLGALMGVVHGLFMLSVVLPIFPGLHPRMASEQHGPTSTQFFEPPGFMGLNYGIRTPIVVLISHIAYGAILGGFYTLSRQ